MNDGHLGGPVTAEATCAVLSMNACVYMYICYLLQHPYYSYFLVDCSEQLVIISSTYTLSLETPADIVLALLLVIPLFFLLYPIKHLHYEYSYSTQSLWCVLQHYWWVSRLTVPVK